MLRAETVGIIARDQTLARRIAVELKRYGVDVDDAAGTPLYQSAAGRLARQVLAVAASDFAAVDTVALLRNAAVSLGIGRGQVWRAADDLDWQLRRNRPLAGLPGLIGLSDREGLHAVLTALGTALAPSPPSYPSPASPPPTSPLRSSPRSMASSATPTCPAAPSFAAGPKKRRASAPSARPSRRCSSNSVLKALLTGVTAAGQPTERDDIAIWGELEARLQSA